MFVEKIEIPAFRALRDVVLDFDGAYDPRIFPLGSENGGGKSTLLQLLFVLLHCSADPARLVYLENLLGSHVHAGEGEHSVIARLTVRMGEERHTLEFLSLRDRFLGRHLKDDNPPVRGFATDRELQRRRLALVHAEDRFERHKRAAERLKSRGGDAEFDFYSLSRSLPEAPPLRSPQQAESYLERTLPRLLEEVNGTKEDLAKLKEDMDRIQALLIALNYHYLTSYSCPTLKGSETCALVCRAEGQGALRTEEVLEAAASKVFLLGPSNQQYLFLQRDTRKALLRTRQVKPAKPGEGKPMRPQLEYLTELDRAETAMDGFFACDWLSVEPLVRLFVSARNEDFQAAVKTGSYGDRYTRLMKEVDALLVGKKVRPVLGASSEVVGVEFLVTHGDGAETALSPEDLSQGELKRLVIYAWLKANHITDALVLIDEIETSFHPDWQVGIVRDLVDWAPDNQYLLATHSYELCQALTPRHVRELRPPLRRGTAAEGKESKDPDG